MNIEKIQSTLELKTRRWWFFLLFILIQFIPPYVSKGFEWSDIQAVVMEIFNNSLYVSCTALYPLFKIIPVLLIISIIFFRNRVVRPFAVYVGITYVLFAVLQNIAVTENYGLGITVNTLLVFVIVAAFWFWEAAAKKNDFTLQKIPVWRYWVVPFAFLAFWYPLNPATMMPDFSVSHLFTNAAGLAFCMMTPVYLALLTLYYPRVNVAALRVTSLVGVIIGFWNMVVSFVIDPNLLWWNGVVHIPLLTISIYGLVLSLRMRRS